MKEIYKNNAHKGRCSSLFYRRCDVLGFGEIEFLTDLGLALVNGLETLTSEHIDLLGGEIRFEQTTELQLLFVQHAFVFVTKMCVEAIINQVDRLIDALPINEGIGCCLVQCHEACKQLLVGFGGCSGNRFDDTQLLQHQFAHVCIPVHYHLVLCPFVPYL